MDRVRYLELLDVDGKLLSRAAAEDLNADVPACPGRDRRTGRATHRRGLRTQDCLHTVGWSTSGPVAAAVASRPGPSGMVRRGARAPAEDVGKYRPRRAGLDVVATGPNGRLLGRAAGSRDRGASSRRAKRGAVTSIDPEPAVDGISEVLVMMLAGEWSHDPQPGSSGTVIVAANDHAWQVVMAPDQIDVGDVTGDAEVRVTGEPSNLLLWLWGGRRNRRYRSPAIQP
jgi:hypothetical protein